MKKFIQLYIILSNELKKKMIIDYLMRLYMIKELSYISFLIGISYFHTLFVFPVITSYISTELYNNIIIFLLVLIKIDNIILYYDYYNNKKVDNFIINDINAENLKIIINQLSYISRKQEEFIYQKHLRYKNSNNRMTRSCNDLNNIQ